MRSSQHDIALQRERLLTEITILSEEQSQVVIAHKARVLLSTAWFKATTVAGKQDILRAVDWLLRLERKRAASLIDVAPRRPL
jgi:hypothetical protein